MGSEPARGCRAVLRLDERGVDIRVLDSTWRGVVAVREAVMTWTAQPGLTLRVDLSELDARGASRFWLSALVSFSRVARVRGCRLAVVAPPVQLADALVRVRLDVVRTEAAALRPEPG